MKFKRILIVLLLVLLVVPITKAQTGLNISAKSAILMEQTTGRILYQKNIDEIHLTASICKILTAITAIEYGELDKYCKVDIEATRQIGSSIYLKVNDEIKLLDLIYGLLLRSGNDAAYLIACNVGKNYDDFIYLMNETAKKIGMTSSTFANPSGLDEETRNYSTARDMAKLMCYAMNNPTYMKINSSKNHSVVTKNNERLFFTNKHRLIASHDEVVCGKTGYTELSKRTLVSGAIKNDMKLVSVTFISGNDFNEHMTMFNYGFTNYKMHTILKKQIIKVNDELYTYTPILMDNIEYPIRDDEINRLKCVIRLYRNPKTYKILGEALIYYDQEIVKKVNIYRYY